MKRPWIACATILLLLLSVETGSLPGNEASKSVSIYVTVEHEGRLVEGLTHRNFRLYEDGQTRPFRLAKPEKPAVVILIEHTRSSWTCLRQIETALKGFLAATPKDYQYALATFANGIRMEVDFTSSRENLLEGFSQLAHPSEDAADSYDSVYEILDQLARFSRGVLILFGSGFDGSSLHSTENIESKIESFNGVVYAVGVATEFRGANELAPEHSPYGSSNEGFLRMLARKSGGQAWFPESESAFRDVMQEISQTIENRYRLLYTPQGRGDGRFNKITVVAFPVANNDNRRFTVTVRDGWRW
jgi:VWFA-related protein